MKNLNKLILTAAQCMKYQLIYQMNIVLRTGDLNLAGPGPCLDFESIDSLLV